MKTKIGIDIVYIPRFKALMQNKSFINKVFHASEIQDYRPEHLAGIFAAKEAFFKSLDKKTLDWLAVEIKSPVVPIKIENVNKILPIGKFWPKPGRVNMKIGKPIRIRTDSYIKATEIIENAVKNL